MIRKFLHKRGIAQFVASRVSGGADGLWHSPSAWIAVAGLALSLTVMLLAVMIVVGFKQQIRSKITLIDPAITVSNLNDMRLTYADIAQQRQNPAAGVDSALLSHISLAIPDNATAMMSTTRECVLRTDSDFAGVAFSAYSSRDGYSVLDQFLTDGNIPDWTNPDYKNQIVISRHTANTLRLAPGSNIDAFFFTNGSISQRKLSVAGIYDSHFPDRDMLQCYASPMLLNRIARYQSGNAQSIEIRGVDIDSIESLNDYLITDLTTYQLQRQSSGDTDAGPWVIENIFQKAGIWLNWLELLNVNVVVILALMGAVGAFTLLSSMFILILERIRLIGILKSLGARNSQITRIFALIACRVVALGLILGNIIPLGLAILQQHYHIVTLDPEAYFIDSVPIAIVWWQILLVNIAVIALSLCIMLIPSHMISRLSPTSSIRFE